MANLGLTHHNGPHGLRISPQMTTMPPMSGAMRLSPSQHPTVNVTQPQLTVHSSPTSLSLAVQQQPPPAPPPNLTSPPNLSVSSNDSISPGSPSDSTSDKIKFDDGEGVVEKNNGTGTAVNMTINNSSDMRTNSIATLRIKAKEHIENISKGLTIA